MIKRIAIAMIFMGFLNATASMEKVKCEGGGSNAAAGSACALSSTNTAKEPLEAAFDYSEENLKLAQGELQRFKLNKNQASDLSKIASCVFVLTRSNKVILIYEWASNYLKTTLKQEKSKEPAVLKIGQNIEKIKNIMSEICFSFGGAKKIISDVHSLIFKKC